MISNYLLRVSTKTHSLNIPHISLTHTVYHTAAATTTTQKQCVCVRVSLTLGLIQKFNVVLHNVGGKVPLCVS